MFSVRNIFPTRKKDLAHILTGFDIEKHRGGIETVTRHLANLLKKTGYEVNLHYAEYCENSFELPNPWLGKVYDLGHEFSKRSLRKTELVILNGYYGGGFLKAHPHVYTIFHSVHLAYAESLKNHLRKNEYWELKHIVGDVFEKNAIKYAKKIIAVSEGVRDELINYHGLNPGSITVVENPVDTRTFFPLKTEEIAHLKEKFSLPKDALIALFVGRLERGKGIEILFRFIENYSEIYFIIVDASDSGVSLNYNNTSILQKIDQKSLSDLYNVSDFLLFPSLYEGFGLTILEALSCGCPVVSYEVGIIKKRDFRRFIEDNYFFLDLKRLETSGLPKKDVLKKFSELRKRSMKGRTRIHEFIKRAYSLDAWERKWFNLLRKG